MNSNNRQRRRIFIQRRFQLRFIFGALAVILLSGLCSALLIYWVTADDLQAQAFSAHVNIAQASDRLGLSVILGNVIAIAVAGAVAVFSVLYGSHKLAGPLYRFENLCQEIGNGNFDGITRLRADDQLQELAVAFSEMVSKLREQRRQRSELIAALYDQLSTMQANAALSLSEREALAKMTEIVNRLEG